MDKIQQIENWFDKNKIEFDKKVSSCSSNGYINYIKPIDNLNTYRDFLFIINYFEDVKEVNVNDIEIEKLVFNLCIIVRRYFGYGYRLESLFEDIKEDLINRNRPYLFSFDKNIKKYGLKYVAIDLNKQKNEFQYLLKNKSFIEDDVLLDWLEYSLIDIIDTLILTSVYIENNKV